MTQGLVHKSKTNSLRTTNKFLRVLERAAKSKISKGLFFASVFGGALLISGCASVPSKPDKEGGPKEKGILVADSGPEKGKLIVVADSGKGTAGVTASSGQGKASGLDPLEGTITVDELTRLEKPQSTIGVEDTFSTSKYIFDFNGHRIAFVVNLCYVSSPGCNGSNQDVSFSMRINRQDFLGLDYGDTRDMYNRENPGKRINSL